MSAARSAWKFPRPQWSPTFPKPIKLADQLGYPVVIRPSFTLGGTGGSIAYNHEEFADAIARALDASPVHQALIEESVIGWKEFELEVMRDCRDNFVVICSIENFDPDGHSHRRFDHRRSRADAHRQGIPAHARRGRGDHSRGGRRNGRLEHSVRRRSRNRPHGRDRDEPARFAQFRARQQGHGIPHREDRREAGAGHDARRNSQRHHAQDSLAPSSRPSITSSRKFRNGNSRNFRAATPRSPRR